MWHMATCTIGVQNISGGYTVLKTGFGICASFSLISGNVFKGVIYTLKNNKTRGFEMQAQI